MAKGGFRGMPGGMNQAAMMKQAQKMQQEMLRMQAEQEAKTFTAASGGGMVTATVNGKHEVIGIEIKPEAVDPDDVKCCRIWSLPLSTKPRGRRTPKRRTTCPVSPAA